MRNECSQCGMDAGDCKCPAKAENDLPLFKPEDTLKDIADAERSRIAAAKAERKRADAELAEKRAARKDNPVARAVDILDILLLDGQVGVLRGGAEDLHSVLGECWECLSTDDKARTLRTAFQRRKRSGMDCMMLVAFAMGHAAASATHEKELPHECGRRVARAAQEAFRAGATVMHDARRKVWAGR